MDLPMATHLLSSFDIHGRFRGSHDHHHNILRLVQCPRQPEMDLFGDLGKPDEISPAVWLLGEKGTAFEHEMIDVLLARLSLKRRYGASFQTLPTGCPR